MFLRYTVSVPDFPSTAMRISSKREVSCAPAISARTLLFKEPSSSIVVI